MIPASTPSCGSALQDLIAVVDRLRDPDGGCPWDLEQTHASLLPYVLEEAHEVADAIRHGDDRDLCEELGDLLLQVVLHARIASEQGRFDLETIATGIREKLIRRHPHVFPAVQPDQLAAAEDAEVPPAAARPDLDAVRRSWEAIKAAERAGRRSSHGSTADTASPADPATGPDGTGQPPQGSNSPLSDQLARRVRGQSALVGAMTISRKTAAAGFEWEDLEGVWQKVQEELTELREAVASGDRDHAREELGDVLFTLVNVARWCDIDPEEGLAGTNRRFLARFSRVERALAGDLQGRSIRELEGLWQQAKAEIRAEASRDSK